MATTLEQERIKRQLCWLTDTRSNWVFPFRYVVNNDVYYVSHSIHDREMFRLTYWFHIIKATMINGEDVTDEKINDIICDKIILGKDGKYKSVKNTIVYNNVVRQEILFEHSYDIRDLVELYNSMGKTKIELPENVYENDYLKACRKIFKGVIRYGLIEPTEIDWDVFNTNKDGR